MVIRWLWGVILILTGISILVIGIADGTAPSAEIEVLNPDTATKMDLHPVDSNTVAYWPFDETTGSTGYDRSSNEYDGDLINGPTWEKGKYENAVELNGTDDYIEIGDDTNFDLRDDFTLECWIYPHGLTDGNGFDRIITKSDSGGSGSAGWRLQGYQDTGQISFGAYISNTAELVISTTELESDTWYHIAVTWDRSTLKLYVDGTLEDSESTGNSMSTNNLPVYIGAMEKTNGDINTNSLFDGLIDEVRISEIVRSSSKFLIEEPDRQIIFIGSGSDSDGTIEEYQWNSSIDDEISTEERFVKAASDLSIGDHNISFRVKDNDNNWSEWKTKAIEIKGTIKAVIDSISPNTANEGESISFDGHGVGENIVDYNWRSDLDGFLSDLDEFSTTSLSTGTHTIFFKVQNNQGDWSDEVTSSVSINKEPSASIDIVNPQDSYQAKLDPIDANTIAYWSFDENSGGVAFDRSSNEHDGEIVNGPTWVSGHDGNALEFDGSNDYTEVTDHSRLDLTNGFTIEAWFSPDSLTSSSGYDRLITKCDSESSSSPGWRLQGYSNSGKMSFAAYISSKSEIVVTTTEFESGSWYHIAVTWDKNTMKLYVNGQLEDSESTGSSMSTNNYPVLIGAIHNDAGGINTNSLFDGPIDELRISDNVRDTSEFLRKAIDRQIIFSGSGTDSDGSIAEYEWKSDVDGLLSTDNRFVEASKDLSNGEHTISFRVKDNDGIWSDWEEISITIEEGLWAIIESISPSVVLEGASVNFDGNGYGNDIQDYYWRSSIDGYLSDQDDFSSSTLSLGNHIIFLKVKNGEGTWSEEEQDTVSVTAKPNAIIDNIDPTFANIGIQNPLNSDTISYWSMDQSSGIILEDESSNTLDGDLVGRPDWVSGKYENALDFDGSNDYVTIDDDSKLDLSGVFTLEVWLKAHSLTDGNGFDRIITKSDSEGSRSLGWRLQGYQDTGKISFSAYISNSAETVVTSTEFDSDTWYHIAITWNKNRLKIFVNGLLEDSVSTGTSMSTNNLPVYIGAIENADDEINANSLFDGLIDEIRISDSIISTTDFLLLQSDKLSINGHGADPDGNITNWEWISSQDGTISNQASDAILLSELSLGLHNISFRVRDNDGYWSDYVYQEIYLNSRPTASIDMISPPSTNEGTSIDFIGSGSDNEGSLVEYEWISSIDGYLSNSSSFSLSSLSFGDHIISLRVKDESGAWSHYDVKALDVNAIPIPYIDSINERVSNKKFNVVSLNKIELVDDDTIAYWSFDEKSGNIINDLSNNNYHGSFQSGPNWISGIDQGALELDGEEYYISIGDKFAFDLSSGFTVEAWIYPDSFTQGNGYDRIISKSDTVGKNSPGWRLHAHEDKGTITFGTVISGEYKGVFSTTEFDAGKWYHIAATWDKQYLKIFVNGILEDMISTGRTMSTNNEPVLIGASRTGDGTINLNSLFDGGLDEIRISDKARDPSDFLFDFGRENRVTLTGHGVDFDGSILNCEWHSSLDGIISTDSIAHINIDSVSTGNHTITLKVQDNNWAWSLPTIDYLIINEPPIATITSIAPNSGFFQEKSIFIGTAEDEDGNITQIEWFSSLDGMIGTKLNFSTKNLSIGYHTIYFKVRDQHDAWSKVTSENLFIDTRPPIPSMESIAPLEQEKGKKVIFNGSGYSKTGNIVAYSWNSSIDGMFSASGNFSSKLLNHGRHTITLDVLDNYGKWNEEQVSSDLWIYTKPVVKVGLGFSTTQGMLIIIQSYSSDEDGTIEKYEWDLNGDGIFDTNSIINGTLITMFNETGNHTITVRVTDNDGFTAEDSLMITVMKLDSLPGESLPSSGILSTIGALGIAVVVVTSFRDGRSRIRSGNKKE